MSTTLEKIKAVEDEMSKTQKNKATSAHLGMLKSKLAKLKRELIEESTKSKGGGAGEGFDVSKSGDARVGLVGFPSVGKSTLLNVLTSTFSEAAAYEFTTLTCIPGQLALHGALGVTLRVSGVIQYKGAKIQLLDLPGIIEGAKDGKGRGRQVISTARTCNLIIIVLDVSRPLTHKRLIEKELEGFGIRLNKTKPDIKISRKEAGGITFTSEKPLTMLNKETIRAICSEYRLISANICFRCDATDEDLIDAIEDNCIYIPCVYAMNKIDTITLAELDIIDQLPHYVPISARDQWNLDELLERIHEYLRLVRVYTKPKGEIPDFNEPVVLRKGRESVLHFCNRIHRNMADWMKHALVWGKSVKYNPQKVGKDHVLEDEDVVQIVRK